MRLLLQLFYVAVLFTAVANLYLNSVDLQIAAALNFDITNYYVRRYLVIPIVLLTAGVIASAVIRNDTMFFSRILRCIPLFLILSTPPVFGNGDYLSTVMELFGEICMLVLLLRAIQFPKFDLLFTWLAVTFLVVSSTGCAVQDPNFIMSSSHQYGCRGLTAHRNTFGPQVNFLLIYLLAILELKTFRKYVLVGLAGMVVFWTASIGSQLIYLIILLATISRDLAIRTNLRRLPIMPLAVVLGMSLLPFALISFADFTAAVGRSESFGAREGIWNAVPGLGPYLAWGEGYKSELSENLRQVLVLQTGWEDVSGMHNSFLNLWREVGLLGALLIFGVLIWKMLKVIVSARFDERLGFFAALAMVCFLVNGLWESGFGPYNSVMSVVCIRLWFLVMTERRAREPRSPVNPVFEKPVYQNSIATPPRAF